VWIEASQTNRVIACLSGSRVSVSYLVRDIVAFERLMLMELLDWLAISTGDAMELAQS